jgi:hypothetical protein
VPVARIAVIVPSRPDVASENEPMGVLVAGIGLALVAAVAVIVLASRGSDEGTSWRTFVDDFKAGWRDRKRREPESEPVDVPFDELFATESRPGDDYLHLDEFAEIIERTGDRAGQLWHRDGTGRLPSQDRGPWTLHPRAHRGIVPAPPTPDTAGAPHSSAPASAPTPRRTSISSQH